MATIKPHVIAKRMLLYLESMSTNNSQVSRNSVSKFDINQVTNNQLFCMHIQLLTIANDDGKL